MRYIYVPTALRQPNIEGQDDEISSNLHKPCSYLNANVLEHDLVDKLLN